MFIELVDALRCPRDHGESWLVLGADRMDGRHVVEGVLGCPVCRAQYKITNGTADLRLAPDARHAAGAGPPPGPDDAVRLAALLDLAEPGGCTALAGRWTRLASALQALADTHLLLVNPPAGAPAAGAMSGLLVDAGFPLAAASLRAVALDEAADAGFAAAAVAAVRPGGRVVAPVAVAIPAGVSELARDTALWVAERVADPDAVVRLVRRR